MRHTIETFVKAVAKLTQEEKVRNNQLFLESQHKLHDAMERSEQLCARLKEENLSKEEKDKITKALKAIEKEMESLAKDQQNLIDRGIV